MERLISRRGFQRLALSAAATVALPRLASAQAFPARPIKLICPWPAQYEYATWRR
jgi:tripartite-type tricarboxylate transporter receptor subunit TctC